MLSVLPSEVLLVVFDSIAHAPSQIALALTCRRMAILARTIQLKLTLISAKYAGFLPVDVFDVPDLMSTLRGWMPPYLRLCGHCLTYRPVSAEYWQGVPGFSQNDFWIQKTGWTFKDARWIKQTHDICPSCHWSCSMSDYVDCDGCRALGKLGDVDFSRVDNATRYRNRQQQAMDHDPGSEAFTAARLDLFAD